MTSSYLVKDGTLSRMACALRFCNLKQTSSVERVLKFAGFTEEEIKTHSSEAIALEMLRRVTMIPQRIADDASKALD